MYSREKEHIVFEKPVQCVGGVEHWLNALLKMHCQSVGVAISQGLQQLSVHNTDLLSIIDNSVLQVSCKKENLFFNKQSKSYNGIYSKIH